MIGTVCHISQKFQQFKHDSHDWTIRIYQKRNLPPVRQRYPSVVLFNADSNILFLLYCFFSRLFFSLSFFSSLLVLSLHCLKKAGSVSRYRPFVITIIKIYQILPTRSMLGFRVDSPFFHLAGQTSPSWLATNCAASTLRSNSLASRPILLSFSSTTLIFPSGLSNECTAISHTLFFDHHTERTA